MVVTGVPCTGMSEEHSFADQLLYSSDSQSCLEAVKNLKEAVIGSDRRKSIVVERGVLPRLVQIMSDETSDSFLMLEASVTLNSVAKGSDEHAKSVIDAGAVEALLKGLFHSNSKYVESCLRCLRTILFHPSAPIDTLYSEDEVIPTLLKGVRSSSMLVQETSVTILSSICRTLKHQNALLFYGAVEALPAVLCSKAQRIQMPSLKLLANLCFQNEEVSKVVAETNFEGHSVLDMLVKLMNRDQPIEMQLASAKCMTYVFRAGALCVDDSRIIYKALPTLVRMCHKDVPVKQRIEAAETLAYLIEIDTELQKIASISNHLIHALADLLKCELSAVDKEGLVVGRSEAKNRRDLARSMKRAAFKAFSSLTANDEEIRKKVIDTNSIMIEIVCGLSDKNDELRLSALCCLHSLSRSVLQLRTTFQDHNVWRPLLKIFRNASDEVLTVVSSTLCNLLLEFSPSKEPILECGTVGLLCELTRREEPALRLNGVWALMNMAFQADLKVKSEILSSMGSSDEIFRLLTDSNVDVLMKSLGLLRNLLTTKPHIDHVMGLLGKQVMQALTLILEGNGSASVKEQALCVLANIADGNFAKNFIMSNEDVLKKLSSYMMHSNVKLQIAATFCICNLIWKDDEGALERQAKLKELGVQQLLQQLIGTTDTALFDKAKTALLQFPADSAVPQ